MLVTVNIVIKIRLHVGAACVLSVKLLLRCKVNMFKLIDHRHTCTTLHMCGLFIGGMVFHRYCSFCNNKTLL